MADSKQLELWSSEEVTEARRAGGLTIRRDRADLANSFTVVPVLNTTEERVRELARISKEAAGSARAMLAMFRGLPGGTESARAALVLGGLPRGGTDEAGFSTYEGTTCEGALEAAAHHLEYAERLLGRHARTLVGEPSRLALKATNDPARLISRPQPMSTGICELAWLS